MIVCEVICLFISALLVFYKKNNNSKTERSLSNNGNPENVGQVENKCLPSIGD